MPPNRPSITTWNRLEPRARATDLSEALAARVRDPAWFLARQWQLGEFISEDCGSPAYIRVEARVSELAAWAAVGDRPRELDHHAPIEAYVTSEPFAPDDLALAVELGQAFDRVLSERHAIDLRFDFLAAYPIADATGEEEPRTQRLRSLWRGRAIDGIALWRAARADAPAAPPGADPLPHVASGVPWSVRPDRRAAAAAAVDVFRQQMAVTYGEPGWGDPPGWQPESLDYALRVYAPDPTGDGVLALDARPDRRGDMDWYAFELGSAPPPSAPVEGARSVLQQAVIPAPVRFRGMPNRRFWDFEDARFDLAAVRSDPRGLASMLLLDFMLVHGNDWYLVPFELPVGTLSASTVWVVDVFGDTYEVPPASTTADRTDARFTMYSVAGHSDLFALPVSAATSILEGAPLEQVRFLRDEIANLVWAVEHIVEGELGRGERSADRPPPPPSAVQTASPGASLRYRIQSPVPPYWIPFQPVQIDAGREEIALERASLLSLVDATWSLPVTRGKILSPHPPPPHPPSDVPYRIREEQVPREGTRVTRLVRRARGADGTTHVWTARIRSVGTGEGSSGLAFDQALFAEQSAPDDS